MTDRSRTFEWSDPVETAGGMAGRSGLEFLQAMASGELPGPPIMHAIGARIRSVEKGEVVFELDPAEYHYNPIGSMHGGVIATLADSALGCCVQSMLEAGVGYTSLDLNVKFLGAVRIQTGTISCRGKVVHLGRRTALAEATVADAAGRLLAHATSSCLILRP